MEVRIKKLPNFKAVVRDVVNAGKNGVYAGMFMIQREAATIVRAERYATGHLARSIQVSGPFRRGDNIEGKVYPDAPYAPFVEYDTRPHVAPMEPFRIWATVKGFRATGRSFRRGTRRHTNLAIAGWLAVKHRGTKGIHFMRRAREARGEEAKRTVIRYLKGAIEKYGG